MISTDTAAPGLLVLPGAATSADDMLSRLERSLFLLGKRVWLTSARRLGASGRRVDRAGYVTLGRLEAAGELRLSDLAAELELDLSTVSRQVKALEELRLVARRPHADDRRATWLTLTADGHDELARLRGERQAELGRGLRHLDDGQRRDLVDLLERVVAALDPPGAACPSAPSAPATREAAL